MNRIPSFCRAKTFPETERPLVILRLCHHKVGYVAAIFLHAFNIEKDVQRFFLVVPTVITAVLRSITAFISPQSPQTLSGSSSLTPPRPLLLSFLSQFRGTFDNLHVATMVVDWHVFPTRRAIRMATHVFFLLFHAPQHFQAFFALSTRTT